MTQKPTDPAAKAHQLLKARLAKGKINPTEADGSSQIDGQGYGDTGTGVEESAGRQIPGTKTIQSPAQAKDNEDPDDLAAKIRAAREATEDENPFQKAVKERDELTRKIKAALFPSGRQASRKHR